ncbi:hypothetical protein FRC06_008229 [Ceratobasidium sp. 370]|nr:hypothetical protein FRC06_008229 [Ceratobasidium sp. 370]
MLALAPALPTGTLTPALPIAALAPALPIAARAHPCPTPRCHNPAPKRHRLARSRSRSRSPSGSRGNQAAHQYDTCSTSYEKRPGKRSGRITRLVNGKEEIVYTSVEKLGTREAKYEYFKSHQHPFGVKHEMYFNPYSTTASDLKNYKQIPRPPGLQIGQGDSTPIHEIIGCQGDYDFYSQFLANLRITVIKYQPKHIQDSKKAKWAQYGTTARRKVYDAILKIYPFCHHFRDATNEDNWVINTLATNYLSHTRSYATEKERTRYLRRHNSGSGRNADDDEEVVEDDKAGDDGGEPDSEDPTPGNGEANYAANTPSYSTASHLGTNHNRNKPTSAASSSRPAASSSHSSLPAQTTNRDNVVTSHPSVPTQESNSPPSSHMTDHVTGGKHSYLPMLPPPPSWSGPVTTLELLITFEANHFSVIATFVIHSDKLYIVGLTLAQEAIHTGFPLRNYVLCTVVAAEEARAKTNDPRASNGAANASGPKGKGKQVEARPTAAKDIPRRDESDSEEEVLCLVPLKPTQPTKGQKRKVTEEAKEPDTADEIQELATKKQKPWPKMRPPPQSEHKPSSNSASSAVAISSDSTVDISADPADAPDVAAPPAPSSNTRGRAVGTKKILVPAKPTGTKAMGAKAGMKRK